MKKILIVRFSSIGDIVLTTPIVRAIRKEFPDAEIHYLTKEKYKILLVNNPYIDRVYNIKRDIKEIKPELKREGYDFIIDLHNNLRTLRLKLALRTKSFSFPKENLKKILLTTFKINKMPKKHIVDRYFECVADLGITNDNQGLDYFIPKSDYINLNHYHIPQSFIVYAIGAQFATKKLPVNKIIQLLNKTTQTIVLLGGKEDQVAAQDITNACSHVINMCGSLNLNQSASIIQQAQKVITHDTGLMHIAAALNKPIISIWGNTVPDFGMYPYIPQNPEKYTINEVKNLKCRPCSKIGYQSCPKKHFNCMNLQNLDQIAQQINNQ